MLHSLGSIVEAKELLRHGQRKKNQGHKMFLVFRSVQTVSWLLLSIFHLLLAKQPGFTRLSTLLPLSHLLNQAYWLILEVTRLPLHDGLITFGIILGNLLQQACFYLVIALWSKSWSDLRPKLSKGEWRTLCSLVLFVAIASTLSLNTSSETIGAQTIIPSLTFRLAFWFWSLCSLKGQLFAIKRYQRKLTRATDQVNNTRERYERLAKSHLIVILLDIVAMAFLTAEGILVALGPATPHIPWIADEALCIFAELVLLICLKRHIIR